MRKFNTEGPVRPHKHYCIAPLDRLNLDDVLGRIRDERYFVLHAPRQTGKTSALLALRDLLNSGDAGDFRCVYVNIEAAQTAREDVGRAIRTILGALASRARSLGDGFLDERWSDILATSGPDGALGEALTRWCEAEPKPVVLLIDEIDTLIGDSLISVLRQLRSGYDRRPEGFPQSVVLCGVRDVRDYRIHSSSENAPVTGGSAFNVRAESLRIGDFTQAEVRALLAQHTAETGQAFTQEALESVWTQTRGPAVAGQCARPPHLLRRRGGPRPLARHHRVRPLRCAGASDSKPRGPPRPACRQAPGRPRAPRHRAAAERRRRAQALGPRHRVRPRPRSDRPRRSAAHRQSHLRRGGAPGADLAAQEVLVEDPAWYIGADGGLDMHKLLGAFQAFFREHSEHWLGRFDYAEAGPQLLLQSFLQRVVNSGGRIEREYGLGRGRTDLLVLWPRGGPGAEVERHVVECKVVHGSLERTIVEGLSQTAAYMDRCASESGHLVVFDRSEGKRWEEKVFRRDEVVNGRMVTVWGM